MKTQTDAVMSEVKDVRKVLEKMRASQPFLEGIPGADVVAAVWSEGLAACDEYDREHAGCIGIHCPICPTQDAKLELLASILRKAGLLQ